MMDANSATAVDETGGAVLPEADLGVVSIPGDAEVLAIIPARGGSVGVPSKNILPLAGKPVICHTIDHARNCARVTRTVVSTDSDEIAAIAGGYGAEVIARPAELATASARIDHALRHAVDTLMKDEGYRPDVVVLLYANVPVRHPDITDRCVEHLLTRGGTSVRTFSDVGKHHPHWMTTAPIPTNACIPTVTRPAMRLPGASWTKSSTTQSWSTDAHVFTMTPLPILEPVRMTTPAETVVQVPISTSGDMIAEGCMTEIVLASLSSSQGISALRRELLPWARIQSTSFSFK